jgi:hypothetical protein
LAPILQRQVRKVLLALMAQLGLKVRKVKSVRKVLKATVPQLVGIQLAW